MTKEDTLKRILAELPESLHSVINTYFPIIWTAGFDEGRKQLTHRKRIVQKKNQKVVQMWNSINEAASAFSVTPTSISKVLHKDYGHKTCAGFEWEFL